MWLDWNFLNWLRSIHVPDKPKRWLFWLCILVFAMIFSLYRKTYKCCFKDIKNGWKLAHQYIPQCSSKTLAILFFSIPDNMPKTVVVAILAKSHRNISKNTKKYPQQIRQQRKCLSQKLLNCQPHFLLKEEDQFSIL